jgi:predicted transcriptional regulator
LKQPSEKNRVKRVQVTFTEEQWSLIERFKGVMGNDDAEVVRNIVLAWLAEKSVVAESVKRKMKEEGGERK